MIRSCFWNKKFLAKIEEQPEIRKIDEGLGFKDGPELDNVPEVLNIH